MTIGVAALWLLGFVIVGIIIAILVVCAMDSGLGEAIAIIGGFVVQVLGFILLVWWLWVMYTQGLNPFEALGWRMW